MAHRPTSEVFRQQSARGYDNFVRAKTVQSQQHEGAEDVDVANDGLQVGRDDEADLESVLKRERDAAMEEFEREKREGVLFRKERVNVKRRVNVAEVVRGRGESALIGRLGFGGVVKKRRVDRKSGNDWKGDDGKKAVVPLVSGYSSSSDDGDDNPTREDGREVDGKTGDGNDGD